jgi:hypothetical protein
MLHRATNDFTLLPCSVLIPDRCEEQYAYPLKWALFALDAEKALVRRTHQLFADRRCGMPGTKHRHSTQESTHTYTPCLMQCPNLS